MILNESLRLSKHSGSHVQLMHCTDSFGVSHERGHVDFYVNGGLASNQTLCSDDNDLNEKDRVKRDTVNERVLIFF